MTGFDAAIITQAVWDARRAEMIRWLITAKRFSPKGAETAARSFIDTMVFVAQETGEPQLGGNAQPQPQSQSADDPIRE